MKKARTFFEVPIFDIIIIITNYLLLLFLLFYVYRLVVIAELCYLNDCTFFGFFFNLFKKRKKTYSEFYINFSTFIKFFTKKIFF